MGVIPEWQQALRNGAARCQQQMAAGPTGAARFWGGVGMAACHLLAGALPGLVAGYGSHLVADLGTPRRLPLLGRGV